MSEALVRRVQRVPADWPILHLEPTIPPWNGVEVDGLVVRPVRLGLAELAEAAHETRQVAVHCVWGWSRPDAVWDGIGMDRLLDLVGPIGSYVTVASSSGRYSACLPIADAARGLLAWRRDGADLAAEEGGPLRFLPPPDHWGYKGVKWAARVSVGDRFVPGFWESRVADPGGRIPDDVELP